MHHWLVLSEPISKWLTGCFLLLQQELKRGRQRRMTENEKEICWKVWEGERSDHLLQWREFVNCIRQTGERCHTGWTNRRQRNGATSDINAGMGCELPAWGSFPMSRQTEWAYSDTPVISNTKTQPTHFLLYNPCWAHFFIHTYVYIQNTDARSLKNIHRWWFLQNITHCGYNILVLDSW